MAVEQVLHFSHGDSQRVNNPHHYHSQMMVIQFKNNTYSFVAIVTIHGYCCRNSVLRELSNYVLINYNKS
jgi:hypothetical protein